MDAIPLGKHEASKSSVTGQLLASCSFGSAVLLFLVAMAPIRDRAFLCTLEPAFTVTWHSSFDKCMPIWHNMGLSTIWRWSRTGVLVMRATIWGLQQGRQILGNPHGFWKPCCSDMKFLQWAASVFPESQYHPIRTATDYHDLYALQALVIKPSRILCRRMRNSNLCENDDSIADGILNYGILSFIRGCSFVGGQVPSLSLRIPKATHLGKLLGLGLSMAPF